MKNVHLESWQMKLKQLTGRHEFDLKYITILQATYLENCKLSYTSIRDAKLQMT